MTLTQFIGRLRFLSDDDDPFRLRNLQPLKPLHESSKLLCEPPESLQGLPKPLREVRNLIKKSSLPTNFVTGHHVGELLKALELPGSFLDEGTSSVISDWAFKDHKMWRSNQAFKNGVSKGFAKNRPTNIQSSDLLGSPGFMTSLREAAREEISDVNSDKTCLSSNTEGESSSGFQESRESSTVAFMQELKNVVECTSTVRIHRNERQVTADVIMGLEDLQEIRVAESSFPGFKKGLVDYSDSEDSVHEDHMNLT